MSLSTSLSLLTHTSRLYLNPVSITFAPFATSDQFLSEGTANLIASALVSLQAGLCQCLSVWHLKQESVSHTENTEHTCSGCYSLQIAVQHCPPFETSPLASSLGSDSFQNCPPDFQVTPCHSPIISVIPRSSLCSFACSPLF